MIINKKHEGRNRAGEGPRRLMVTGGYGGRPSYEGAALDWHLCPGLTSVGRLRIISRLCSAEHMRTADLAAELEISPSSVQQALWGMRDLKIVQCARLQDPKAKKRPGAGHLALDWWVTESGRRWFWRFAWVTGRLDRSVWEKREFDGREDLAPWEVLRRGVEPTLLRPMALAAASWAMDKGVFVLSHVMKDLEFGGGTNYLETWKRMGWLAPCERPQPRYSQRVHWRAKYLRMVPEAYRAVTRHADALRYAAQACGHRADEDINWYHDYLMEVHPDGDFRPGEPEWAVWKGQWVWADQVAWLRRAEEIMAEEAMSDER